MTLKSEQAEERLRANFNFTRFSPGDAGGFYESFFQRANHPSRPLAFWNRYTIFSPAGRPNDTIGELWSIFFDGESGKHTALKTEVPFARCQFARDRFFARVGDAVLEPGRARGALAGKLGRIDWNLEFAGDEPPLWNLPVKYYEGGFPKAKVLVGLPLARYNGEITVNGNSVPVRDWIGSQNHNWGVRHTDRYAWGQVAGFDNAPDVFLELATAQIRIGPLWTPALTPIVLRRGEREFRLNDLFSSTGRASYRYFHWEFRAKSKEINLRGTIEARPEDFVCLPYYNPPGGVKFCLNSKIAACRIELSVDGGPTEVLETRSRAAFEILTDDKSHGLRPAL